MVWRKRVLEVLAALRGAEPVRVVWEGPSLAVYVRRPERVAKEAIVEAVRRARVRIVVRAAEEARCSPRELERALRSRGVEPRRIVVEDCGDAIVLVDRVPELRAIAFDIFRETGWRIVPRRTPPPEATTYASVLELLYARCASERRRVLAELGEAIHREPRAPGKRMLRITFVGATRSVGRSAVLVETPETRVLLDFGADYSGAPTPPPLELLGIEPSEIDAVVVSHAHLDHVGMVPLLVREGFRGIIVSTPATRDLAAVLLMDAIRVVHSRRGEAPFTAGDVESALLRWVTVGYGEAIDLGPDMKLTLIAAGHVLGSAQALLSYVDPESGRTVSTLLYTGDVRPSDTLILRPCQRPRNRIDAMIAEGTYGGRTMPDRASAVAELIEALRSALYRGGKALLPVLAVGRAQEVLYAVRIAADSGALPRSRIVVDGMLREITALHVVHADLLADPLRREAEEGRNPFEPEKLEIVAVDRPEEREYLAASPEPMIIVAAGGMLNGGPALQWLRLVAPDHRSTIVLTCYQAPGTVGRQLLEGAKRLRLNGGEVEVRARVVSVEGFSGHGDHRQMLRYVAEVSPSTLFLVHGEEQALWALANDVRKRGAAQRVYVPDALDSKTLLHQGL